MIELFDASRLTVRRDHSFALAVTILLVVIGMMAGYGAWLKLEVNQRHKANQALQSQLGPNAGASKTAPSPKATLVADLQRQAEQLEREIALASGRTEPMAEAQGLTPAQWLKQLGSLSQPDSSLQKIEIERSGSARIEGLSTSPQAVDKLLQAWEQQAGLAHLQPRTLELKQDKVATAFLRFQLRATPSAHAPSATAAASGSSTRAPER